MSEEVRFNVLNHQNVPLHEVLSSEEAKEVLARYKVAPEQLPKIRSIDPAVQVVKAQPGDVIRITRRSPTAGTAVAYRIVTQPE